MDPGHQPVLAEPVLALLAPRPGGFYLDCTIGRGGHAELISKRLGPEGRVIGLDVDPANVDFSRARLSEVRSRQGGAAFDVVPGNFADARTLLDHLGVERVDLLLADLGFASSQMDDPSRGLSFAADGPLDMRFDPSATTTAAEIVNGLEERALADLIYEYGEERLSRKIARKIVEKRGISPINSTLELAELVRQAYGARGHRPRRSGRPRLDPATRTFMALRIAVNLELDVLGRLLDDMPNLMRPGGVSAVISFHSLEDRMVKHAIRQWQRDGIARRLTPKPVVADAGERQANPRSRSAKLRAAGW
ncbi:MAG: 16S rRNA (cytosine(1402)-N(4))-methyltransferase [Phycisphaeraceae bacterium]|nr:16S rRNA (cytosine(1402)-N(4))-methyltransferase [Phycisphaeraceae bacterium]